MGTLTLGKATRDPTKGAGVVRLAGLTRSATATIST